MKEAPEDKSYVYFHKHVTGERFKIGRAKSVKTRAIRFPDIDSAASWAICFPDDPECHRANRCEQLLHDHFAEDRCPAFEGDGGTEWFFMRAYDEVVQYVQDNQNRLGWSHKREGSELFPPPRRAARAYRKAHTRIGKCQISFAILEEEKKRLKAKVARINTTEQIVLEGLLDEWLDSSERQRASLDSITSRRASRGYWRERIRQGKEQAAFWTLREKRKRLKQEAARLNVSAQDILEDLLDEWLASPEREGDALTSRQAVIGVEMHPGQAARRIQAPKLGAATASETAQLELALGHAVRCRAP